jgi:hypothetical protein
MLSLKTYMTLLFFTLVLVACSRKLNYEELTDYIKDPEHGLLQEKVVNGVRMKVIYRPSDMFVYQELHGRDNISKADIKEARGRYSQQHYFVLSLSYGEREILSDASDRNQFSMLVNQFAFGMDRNVLLTTADKDTLQLLDFHFPRMYAVTPSTDILFAFEKNGSGTKYIELKVSEFGLNTGDSRYRFYIKNINKIPSLLIQEIK